MVRKKDRRNSGWVTPSMTVSKKELIEYALVINSFYDDWRDWRDGMRDQFGDFKLIKKNPAPACYNAGWREKRRQMNQKQQKLLKRRLARRWCHQRGWS